MIGGIRVGLDMVKYLYIQSGTLLEARYSSFKDLHLRGLRFYPLRIIDKISSPSQHFEPFIKITVHTSLGFE